MTRPASGIVAGMRRRMGTLAGGAGSQDRFYLRAVATLTGGSFAAQLVGILSMLVLARIYAPDEFGSYAVFFAVAGLLTLVATAKYDAAVYVARNAREAAETALLSAGISVLVGSAVLACVPLAPLFLTGVTRDPVLFIVLLAAATSSGGLVLALIAWATQVHQFRAVTMARLGQAISMAVVSIALGLRHWDMTGLAIGFIAGQLVFVAYLSRRLKVVPHLRRFTRRTMGARARRHAAFPKFLLASELINYAGGNMIAFTGAPLFGAAALGQYSLGFRLATMPINMVGQAMGSVFRTAISPQHLPASGIPALYRATFIRLSAIGLAFTIPLIVAGPQLFRLAFGAQWALAGFYVQILAPFMFMRFVVAPLTAIALRAGRAGLDTMIQLLFLASSVIAVAVGAWAGSFTVMLIAFTTLQSLVYLFYLVLGYRLALRLARNEGQ